VILKRKKVSALFTAARSVGRTSPDETAALVKAKLAQLSGKNYTVLAKYKASSGPDHEVRLGSNNAVYCTGKCWQYSKNGTCKHIEDFKVKCVAQKFDRPETN
jgi:hypothetical protein